MGFVEWVNGAGDLLEGVGVATIVVGALLALVPALERRRAGSSDVYRAYRQALGKSILLGLELLVGADIIRTVSHVPSAGQVAVLGGIVVIRTFLSFTLEVELEGRWPWQRATVAAPPAGDGAAADPGPVARRAPAGTHAPAGAPPQDTH